MDFASIKINGTLKVKTVTVGSNSVVNTSQILPYFKNNFLDASEDALLISARTFTEQDNGIVYAWKPGLNTLWNGSPSSGNIVGRFKDEVITDVPSASSYSAKLKAGDMYCVLYMTTFVKS